MTTTANLETDLVIVGGGGAGMIAAAAAAENGCKRIIVLEKAATPAGSTSMAHDVFAAESPVQKRAGVDAQRDHLFKVAMEWDHWNRSDGRLWRAMIDKSGDTIRWLEEKGLRFELIQFYQNQAPLVRHGVVGHGQELMKCLRETCQKLGVEVLTRIRAKKLIREGNGPVTGVLAETKDGEVTISAKKVIVATGGYGANKEMLKKTCPWYHENVSYNGMPTNTGDGLTMAVEAGAATINLGSMNLHGPFLDFRSRATFSVNAKGPDGKSTVLMNLWYVMWEPCTIWVNKHGKRFMDEAFSMAFFAHGAAVLRQPGCVAYSLFDDATLQQMEGEGLIRPGAASRATWLTMEAYTPLPGLVDGVRKLAGKGVIVADSWDEIASGIGCDAAVLKAEIDRENASYDAGRDALFAKERRYLRPLRTPPFYAIKGDASICETTGGVKINENMEALDTRDQVIPGLYIAGHTAGGVESESYCYPLTGHLVGWALNSGRIAGENAARELSR